MDDNTERFLNEVERDVLLGVMKALDGVGLAKLFEGLDPAARLERAALMAQNLQVQLNEMLDGRRPMDRMLGTSQVAGISVLRAISVGYGPEVGL